MTTLSENQNAAKNESPQAPSNFPQYQRPTGIPLQPDAKFHKPLFSLASKMLKGKGRATKGKAGKGIKSDQDVHVGHRKKPRFY